MIPFEKWIFSFKTPINTGITMILGVSSLLIAIFTLTERFQHFFDITSANLEQLLNVNLVVHIVLMLILILFPGLNKFTKLSSDKSRREEVFDVLELEHDPEVTVLTTDVKSNMVERVYKRATVATLEFLYTFRRVLYSLLFLYCVVGIDLMNSDYNLGIDDSWINFFQILTNNLATLFLVFCFVILSVPSKSPYKTHIQNRDIYIVLLIAITFLEITLRLIFKENQDFVQSINKAFFMLSGILGSIATAQIAGRLDSKLIDAKHFTFVLIYFYAALQPLFPLFMNASNRSDQLNFIVILYLALFLKCIFFLFIYWSIHYNKLFYYFVRVNRIQSIVESSWNKIAKIIHDDSGDVVVRDNI